MSHSKADIRTLASEIPRLFGKKFPKNRVYWIARALAARHGLGVVATRNVLDTEGDIWAAPVSMLVWLLGS